MFPSSFIVMILNFNRPISLFASGLQLLSKVMSHTSHDMMLVVWCIFGEKNSDYRQTASTAFKAILSNALCPSDFQVNLLYSNICSYSVSTEYV